MNASLIHPFDFSELIDSTDGEIVDIAKYADGTVEILKTGKLYLLSARAPITSPGGQKMFATLGKSAELLDEIKDNPSVVAALAKEGKQMNQKGFNSFTDSVLRAMEESRGQ